MGRFTTSSNLQTQGIVTPQPCNSGNRFTSYNYYETQPRSNKGTETETSFKDELLQLPTVDIDDEESMHKTEGGPRIIIFDQEQLENQGARVAETIYEGFFWSLSDGPLHNSHLQQHGQEARLAVELLCNVAVNRPDNLKIYPNKGTGRLVITTHYPSDQRYHLLPIPALMGFCDILEVSSNFDYTIANQEDLLWRALFSRITAEQLKSMLPNLDKEKLAAYSDTYLKFWLYAGNTFPHFQQEDLLAYSESIGFSPTSNNMGFLKLYKSPELVLKYTRELWETEHPNSRKHKNPYRKKYSNVPLTCYTRHEGVVLTGDSEKQTTYYVKHSKLAPCNGKNCGKCPMINTCYT